MLKAPGENSVLTDALLGGGLPEEADFHLRQAGLAYERDALAEEHLRRADSLAPGHAAVLIGFYRFYFYKGRLEEALRVARLCLAKAARDNDLPADWGEVAPGDAVFDRYDDIRPRFFLFTLKAYGYLQMRLGNFEEGRRAVEKLLELDPGDKIGARILLQVLDRKGQDEDG